MRNNKIKSNHYQLIHPFQICYLQYLKADNYLPTCKLRLTIMYILLLLYTLGQTLFAFNYVEFPLFPLTASFDVNSLCTQLYNWLYDIKDKVLFKKVIIFVIWRV